METDASPVQATKTTLEIVETLRKANGAGVSELAAELGRPTSTIHDHLQTLVDAEYLVNDDGTYRVGVRFLELGEQARARMKVHEIARPEVKQLADETGEHSNLLIEEHGWGVFLQKSRGPAAVQLDTHAGMRVQLQTTALGKAILAYRPRDEVEAILDRHGMPAVTENTITDREELYESLDEIRDRGYALDDEERIEGMRCVAAPITDTDDRAIAAVSVSGPKSRMQGEAFAEDVPGLVMRSANVIEVNLTHS